jgi:DNA-binding response OmpR family regulator
MPQRTARRRILCIEDDRECARLIAEELVDRGFEVRIAYNGVEGVAAIETGWPDLILCDICMPGISGFDVLKRSMAQAPRRGKTPFIFVTALTELDTEIKARRLGADGYIAKPINFDMLATVAAAPFPVRRGAMAAPLGILGTSERHLPVA